MSERWRIEPGYFTKVDPVARPARACCSSRRPWWPRPGSWSRRCARGRSGSRARCWSPAPAPSACSRRSSASRTGSTSTCWTGSPRAPSRSWCATSAPPTTPAPSRTSASSPTSSSSAPAWARSSWTRSAGSRPVAWCCLTGVGGGGAASGLSPADVAKALVLQNNVVLGSVNANRRHFYKAAQALAAADRAWLGRLISRRVAPADIADGAAARPRRHQGRPGLRSADDGRPTNLRRAAAAVAVHDRADAPR